MKKLNNNRQSQTDLVLDVRSSSNAEPIYETVIYIKLYKEVSTNHWVDQMTINSLEMGTDVSLGYDFDVTSNRLLVGDQREADNLFTSTSSLLLGNTKVKYYDMVENTIYTIDENNTIFAFEY